MYGAAVTGQKGSRAFQASLDPADAVGCLLRAPEFPRSVLHRVSQCETVLISGQSADLVSESRRQIGMLRAQLQFAHVRATMSDGLDLFLADPVERLEQFSATLGIELFDSTGEVLSLDDSQT